MAGAAPVVGLTAIAIAICTSRLGFAPIVYPFRYLMPRVGQVARRVNDIHGHRDILRPKRRPSTAQEVGQQ